MQNLSEKKEFRIYHFGNFYLSSIQQGIQAAHAQMEMFVKYEDSSKNYKQRADLFEWAHSHKTMICLNGGMNVNLENIKELFETSENPFAWSYFKESKEAMDGILTNVAIILPNRIYELASYIRSNNDVSITLFNAEFCVKKEGAEPEIIDKLSEFEFDLISLLNSCSLAK